MSWRGRFRDLVADHRNSRCVNSGGGAPLRFGATKSNSSSLWTSGRRRCSYLLLGCVIVVVVNWEEELRGGTRLDHIMSRDSTLVEASPLLPFRSPCLSDASQTRAGQGRTYLRTTNPSIQKLRLSEDLSAWRPLDQSLG